jgi:hypothetical protein
MRGEPGDDSDAAEEEEADESTQVWEHIKSLRKRVASFN